MLLIILLYLTIKSIIPLRQQNGTTSFKIIHSALLFSLASSIGATFGLNTEYISFKLLLLITNLLFILYIFRVKNITLQVYGTLFVFGYILLLGRLFFMDKNILQFIGPIFELFILLTILTYIYHKKLQLIDILIVLTSSISGLFLAKFILTLDVPPLIIKTVFEQTLGVSQFTVTELINNNFFFILHFMEIFAIIALILLTKPNINILSLIFSAGDLTYGPTTFLRIIALIYINYNLSSGNSEEIEIKTGEH